MRPWMPVTALLFATFQSVASAAPVAPDAPTLAQARPEQDCQAPKIPQGKEFVVLAAGAYGGRRIDIQLDQSGHQATQIDVIVNTGPKAVVLMLGAYEPTVWNIKWTRNTSIAAIFASGYHRQVVVGVPKDLPVLISGTEMRGPCPSFYINSSSNGALNPIARRLFGQPVAMVYPADKGQVTVGDPVSSYGVLLTSNETTLESYIDRNAPPAGEAGLVDGVRRGLLREATQADANAWAEHLDKMSGPRDEPPIAGGGKPRRAVGLYRAYVVLGPFTYPAGLYGAHSATFFIPKGVPRPRGEPGHSTVYDFNPPAAQEEVAFTRARPAFTLPLGFMELSGKALDWDATHDNTFRSKTEHAREYQQTRTAFVSMHVNLMQGVKLLEEQP